MRLMNDTITIPHFLTNFQVTKKPESVPTFTGKKLAITRRSLDLLKVDRVRLTCRSCDYMEYQKIPFKATGHRITGYLKAYIMKYPSQKDIP